MQEEPGQYEIPAERLVVTYGSERLGEGRDLGRAVVVSTLFGKPKVRIVREGDQPRWLWPLFAVLLAGGIAAAIWFWIDGPREQLIRNDVPELVPAPPAPPVIEMPATAPQPGTDSVNQPAQRQPTAGTSPTGSGAEKAAMPKPETRLEIAEPARKAAAKKRTVEEKTAPPHPEEGASGKAAKAQPAVLSGEAKPAKAVAKKELPPAGTSEPAGEGGAVSGSAAPSAGSKTVKSPAKHESSSVPPEAKPSRENGATTPPVPNSQPPLPGNGQRP